MILCAAGLAIFRNFIFWEGFFRQLGMRRAGVADCALTCLFSARNKFYFFAKAKNGASASFLAH